MEVLVSLSRIQIFGASILMIAVVLLEKSAISLAFVSSWLYNVIIKTRKKRVKNENE